MLDILVFPPIQIFCSLSEMDVQLRISDKVWGGLECEHFSVICFFCFQVSTKKVYNVPDRKYQPLGAI